MRELCDVAGLPPSALGCVMTHERRILRPCGSTVRGVKGVHVTKAVPTEEFIGLTERLRTAMQARGFWDVERDGPAIARFCRTHPQFDARYMASYVSLRVKRRPSLPALRQLAVVLDVSTTYLLLGPFIYEEQEWARILAHRRTVSRTSPG